MANNLPDERLVYLALKDIFQGKNARIRKAIVIRKLIKDHCHQKEVETLIQEHTIDDVRNIARLLLMEGIFESTLKAKGRFPNLFEVSPAQFIEIQHMMREQQDNSGERRSKPTEDGLWSRNPYGAITATGSLEKSHLLVVQSPQTASTVSRRYPVYLPFNVQHRLLVNVQTLLEKACFSFAQERLHGVLQEEGWECSEAVELNRWCKIFLDYEIEFSRDEMASIPKPLPILLKSIAQLRHTAVHRLHIVAKKVLQFIIDGELLANLVQSHENAHVISEIRQQTTNTIKELKRNKDMLQLKQVEVGERFAGPNWQQALAVPPPTVMYTPLATVAAPSPDTETEAHLLKEVRLSPGTDCDKFITDGTMNNCNCVVSIHLYSASKYTYLGN
ncbi:unnamed protein product [Periconia digitata]|uniref:Uncharacterized protein n=1 Tax=Periconia digitata TaxID=1303443 RepID=A0A9W4UU77_9PLEO|nr:unnamed protein product [Periconia digitata]